VGLRSLNAHRVQARLLPPSYFHKQNLSSVTNSTLLPTSYPNSDSAKYPRVSFIYSYLSAATANTPLVLEARLEQADLLKKVSSKQPYSFPCQSNIHRSSMLSKISFKTATSIAMTPALLSKPWTTLTLPSSP
jgi:hypothetical protein